MLLFHVIEIKKGSKSDEEVYRDMAEIFTRINRAGVRLGNLEMFLSFFASAMLAKEEITRLYKEINKEYSIDLEPVIRFVFSNLGLTQSQISKVESFKKAVENVKKNYSKKEIEEIIEKCGKSIETTMILLRENLGIVTAQILPSETALVPLFQYVYSHNLESEDKDSMCYWFILASFNGLYTSRTDTRLEEDLRIIKEAGDGFPLKELKNSMLRKINIDKISEKDFKNIDTNILRGNVGKRYLFILYILLHKNGATDWAGHLISEKFAELARHHIFPREKLKEAGIDDVMINHLGNITYINQSVNLELRDKLPGEYLGDYNSKILEKHFIPLDRELWALENYERFVDKRMDLLWSGFQQIFGNLQT